TGARPLGTAALAVGLDGALTLEVAACVLLVGADVGADGLDDPAILQQQSEALAVGTAVVGDDGQFTGALVTQCVDEEGGDTDEAEPADGDGGTVRDIGHGFSCG